MEKPDVKEKILGSGGNESPTPNQIREEQDVSLGIRFADTMASFSGSVLFLILNAVWFTLWISVNTMFPASFRFDPYPYQFLTLSVSLEAIFLSIFVLISQNRQAAKDRLIVDLDYEANMREEKDEKMIIEMLHAIEERLQHTYTSSKQNQEYLKMINSQPYDERLFTLSEGLQGLENKMEQLIRDMRTHTHGKDF